MEVKIGKGLLSQTEKPFGSGGNKITPDDSVKFPKETDGQYNHRVNTGRERYARLPCRDGKIRNVTVAGEKKESEKWGPGFCYCIETDNGIIPASYEDIIYRFKIIQIMTLKEAKKILEKEFAVMGLHKPTEPFEFDGSGWIGHEKPSVPEAFRVLAKEGYCVTVSGHDCGMRRKRLQKEYGQPKEKVRIICCSASRFNGALPDEQAKKIKCTKEKNLRSGREIARPGKVICKKNMKIGELGEKLDRKTAVENEQWISDFFNNAMNGFILIKKK